MSKLKAIRIGPTDFLLVEIMRQMYITAIPHLTKPLVPLTPAQQAEWWQQLPHDTIYAFLYVTPERPWEPVGFSLVQDHGDYATPLFALEPWAWGRGYGREIIQHYIRVANKPLRGEQLVANDAIRHLNREAGWKIISSDGRVEYLEHPGPANKTPFHKELKYPLWEEFLGQA